MKVAGSWLAKLLSLVDRPLKRQVRLMEIDKDRTPEGFVRACAELRVDEDICREVLSALRGLAALEAFVPAAQDDLLGIFGLADEDLDDDLVLPLLSRLSCKVPTPGETAEMPPVRTVGDLVRFLQQMRLAGRQS